MTTKSKLQPLNTIELDERGIVLVHDEDLLALVSGAASAPSPGGGASSPPATNTVCGNNIACGSNIVCPGGGSNALCHPMPR